MIEEEVDGKRWHPIRAGRNRPSISHLMFADDLLLFGKATNDNMRCVMEVLNNFCEMSGQMVSSEKTSIFFSKNVDTRIRRRLSLMSGFTNTTSMGKYFGIPLLGRTPKKQDFNYLIEKVTQRLSGVEGYSSFVCRACYSCQVCNAIYSDIYHDDNSNPKILFERD